MLYISFPQYVTVKPVHPSEPGARDAARWTKSTARCWTYCSRMRRCRSRRWPSGSGCRRRRAGSGSRSWRRRGSSRAGSRWSTPTRVGVGLSVLVSIEAGEHTPEWLQRFSDGVAAMPEVMEVYRMAGDVDYMLRVAVADMAEYDALLQAADRARADEERHLALRDGAAEAHHRLSAASARLPRPPRRRGRDGDDEE